MSGRQQCQLPCIVLMDGSHFLSHRSTPWHLLLCFTEGGQLLCRCEVEIVMEDPTHKAWSRTLPNDLIDGAKSERSVIVVGVEVYLLLFCW
jgi:hypothetical protein